MIVLQFCGFSSETSKIITWGTQGEFELNGKKVYAIRERHLNLTLEEEPAKKNRRKAA